MYIVMMRSFHFAFAEAIFPFSIKMSNYVSVDHPVIIATIQSLSDGECPWMRSRADYGGAPEPCYIKSLPMFSGRTPFWSLAPCWPEYYCHNASPTKTGLILEWPERQSDKCPITRLPVTWSSGSAGVR